MKFEKPRNILICLESHNTQIAAIEDRKCA